MFIPTPILGLAIGGQKFTVRVQACYAGAQTEKKNINIYIYSFSSVKGTVSEAGHSSTMPKQKVLLLRSSSATLDEVLKKAADLNSKSGPFDATIITGAVLTDLAFKPANPVSFPVYVTNGGQFVSELRGSHTICDKLILLNEHGIYELPSGMKIGYFTPSERIEPSAVDAELEIFKKVGRLDILLTKEWPKSVRSKLEEVSGTDTVDQLVISSKPQYHFATLGDKYFELEPFGWDRSSMPDITRFINLATFGSGEKWAYAFNITVGTDQEASVPTNLTTNPFITMDRPKRDLDSDPLPPPKKRTKVLPAACHFCLSNPSVEDHMVISIGKHSYLTIAKGPLSVPRGEMTFSGHCLIIPIDHVPKFNSASPDQTTSAIMETEMGKEVMRYESALVNMNYKKFDMSTLVFEINSVNSVHFHKQVVPVPKYLIGSFTTALDRQLHINNEKFKKNANFTFQDFEGLQHPDFLALVNDPKTNYMQFTVYETHKASPKVFIATFKPEDSIDLQFGRRVAAFLLKLPKRVIWNSKACLQSKEEEEIEVKDFQRSFQDFEFTE
ncbi:FADR034Wp [Eremothecium gossypii FDAG1]|nr:FADR034Wp [Eremothecium gossypii FDAG1]